MGGSYKGGNEDICPFSRGSLSYPYDGNCGIIVSVNVKDLQ